MHDPVSNPAREREGRRLVSIVIPVYNSPAIEALADSVAAVFRETTDEYELIFVDDGSPDPDVWPALERLSRAREHVRAVQLTRNFGQHAATLCGLREARGDVVVTLDDDGQHDPADIPSLLAAADHDIVIGELRQKEHHLFRRAASWVKGVFDRLAIGKPKHLRLSSFRVLRRTVVDGVLAIRTPNPFLPALMFHVSQDVVGVPVRHRARASGRSGYTSRKLAGIFGALVINNSAMLLRTVACMGVLFGVLSCALAMVVIYRKLAHAIAVQGWASLFAAILLIGGVLLFSVGLIGEYLIRIIEIGEARPSHFVRRRAG